MGGRIVLVVAMLTCLALGPLGTASAGGAWLDVAEVNVGIESPAVHDDCTPPPTPPRDLTVQRRGGISQNAHNLLLWTEPLSDGGHDLVRYNVYRADGHDGNSRFVFIASVNASVTEYQDFEINARLDYSYAVTAVVECAAGTSESRPSNVANDRPGPCVQTPDIDEGNWERNAENVKIWVSNAEDGYLPPWVSPEDCLPGYRI